MKVLWWSKNVKLAARNLARRICVLRPLPMKPVRRLVYSPTRSPRLNEMLGLVVLVAAGLLLLALLTYTPSDPSFNTVGGAAGLRPAHNWTGIAGAYVSDLLLQTLGVAIFFVPLLLVRVGISWMRSRSIGSLTGKSIGLALWLLFAPAAIALLPGHLRWRGAVPLSGLIGSTLADGLNRHRAVTVAPYELMRGIHQALSGIASSTH